jgi:hypothetical protein
MTTRKILGYILIVVAIILTLAIVGQLPKLIGAIIGVFKIFTGALDSYQVGKVIGTMLYWTVHIALTIILWIYGRRWIKHKKVE